MKGNKWTTKVYKLFPELKAAKKFTTADYIRAVTAMLYMTYDELVEIRDNKAGVSSINSIVASILIDCIDNPDAKQINYVLDRVIGKMVEAPNEDDAKKFKQVIVNFIPAGKTVLNCQKNQNARK